MALQWIEAVSSSLSSVKVTCLYFSISTGLVQHHSNYLELTSSSLIFLS